MNNSANFCLICAKELLLDSYNVVFDASPKTDTPLRDLLFDLLRVDNDSSTSVTDVVRYSIDLEKRDSMCQRCFNLLIEFEDMKTQIKEIRERVSSRFQDQKIIDSSKKDVVLERVLHEFYPSCHFVFKDTDENGIKYGECTIKDCDCKVWIRDDDDDDDGDDGNYSIRELSSSSGKVSNRHIYERNRQEFREKFICEFCLSRLSDIESLTTHLKTHEDGCYTCVACDTRFSKFVTRNNHYLLVHCTETPYKCLHCLKRFKIQSKLKEHSKKCGLSNGFSCPQCGKVLISRRNLRDHLNVVHKSNDGDKPYKCDQCSKDFYKKINYESHLLRHSSDKTFVCDIENCGKKFKREKALKVHQVNLHSAEKPFHLCTFCGKGFSTVSGLKQHLTKHTGEEYVKRDYVCDDCDKRFRSPADLRTHRVVHTKEKPYSCSVCSASFSQRASLKDHLNVHLNTYQCEICKKAFGRLRYLEQHFKSCGQVKAKVTLPSSSSSDRESVQKIQIIKEDSLDNVTLLTEDVQHDIQMVTSEVETTSSMLAHLNREGTITMLQYAPTENVL